MKKLREIATSYVDHYMENTTMPLSANDLENAFAYGAMWGKSFLWNKVGSDNPSSKHPYRQIAIVLMEDKETFDIDIVRAEDYESYINNNKCIGTPVLWCYVRDLLFKRIKLKSIIEIDESFQEE